mgnify:CR=1 FL=1
MAYAKYWKGKTLSQAHRDKISKGTNGRKAWNNGKASPWAGRNGFKKGKPPWNKGKHYPQVSGEKCHLWKGGVSQQNRTERANIMSSLEYKIWRKGVFEKDNYTCIWCGARSGKGKAVELHADHIKPFKEYPELRFALDNGRTLCVPCHKTTVTWGRRKSLEVSR